MLYFLLEDVTASSLDKGHSTLVFVCVALSQLVTTASREQAAVTKQSPDVELRVNQEYHSLLQYSGVVVERE